MRVEAATYKGQLVSFHIEWPWDTRGGTVRVPQRALAERVLGLVSFLLAIGGFLFGLWIAYRNLKAGRGDRRGAFRLAAAFFAVATVQWVMRQHMMPDLELIGYAFQGTATNLMFAGLVWMLYLALEPSVRARWPQSLITWNRVLAGNFTDARVGSHILIGASMGMVLFTLLAWRYWWGVTAGTNSPDSPNLAILSGVRPFFTAVANTTSGAITTGLIIFFLLCGIRAIVRIDWVASLVASVLLAMQQSDLRTSANLWMDAPVYVAIFAAFAFLLLRMGLVPAITAILMLNLSSAVPFGADIRSWTTGPAVALILLIASIPVYGFWRSRSTHVRAPHKL